MTPPLTREEIESAMREASMSMALRLTLALALIDADRYRWLRDVADGAQRDTALDTPCGHTPDESEYATAHAAAVDASIDKAMGHK